MTIEASPNLIPRTSTVRLILIAFLLYSFHILVYFKGKLISVLTNPGRIPAITSIEELAHSDITPITFMYIFKEIDELDFPTAQKLARKIMKMHNTISSATNLKLLMKNTGIAIPIIRTSLEMYTFYKDKIDIVSNDYLPNLHATYSMRKGYHLAPSINEIIKRVMESGFQEKWYEDS